MATYPLQGPIIVRTPPTGQPWLDVRASALAPVLSPVNGWVRYVGEGTDNPYDKLAPGVVVVRQLHKPILHVLGYLDRNTLRARWGKLGEWNIQPPEMDDLTWDPQPSGPSSPFGQGVANIDQAIHDKVWGPPSADGLVTEGSVIGYVAPSRGMLRWEVRDDDTGARTNPLVWAADEGLPAPRQVDDVVRPTKRASSGNGLIVLIAILLLVSMGRKRR